MRRQNQVHIMASITVSRREWLSQAAVAVAAVAGAGTLLAACKGGGGSLSCADTTGLSEADIATRTANAYVEATTNPAQNCANCVLYVVGAPNACGGCTVVKGPINPAGWCNIWVARG